MSRLTVAIPTYQRPSILESFVKKHYEELAKREISLAIFHNESNPLYSPECLKYLKTYFAKVNIGIAGNQKRMCEQFQSPNEYWMPLSDQDTINMEEVDKLLRIISNEDFDCLKFEKGESQKMQNVNYTYYSNYLDWLKIGPISEIPYVFRGRALSCLTTDRSYRRGSAMWDAIPTHTLLLMKACQEGFIGLDTNLKLVHDDVLGSVTSGWTSWVPNIISCHVMFIKFLMYAEAHTTTNLLSIRNQILIKEFLPGLINHMYISTQQNMYSGKRLAKIAVQIIKQNRDIVPNYSDSLLEEYERINNSALIELPEEWSKQFDLMNNQRKIFAETYPAFIR